MRKRTPRTPSYRVHRPSGQAIVGIEGKTFYLGPWGSPASREEYDRIIGRWMSNGRHLPRDGHGVAPITIAELVERYVPHAEETYPTNVSAIAATCRYLVRHCGRTSVAGFDSLDVKAIVAKMIDDGLSRTYINDHIARIKRLFGWAVAARLADPATLATIREVRGERKGKSKARESAPVLPVAPAIVDQTLPHLPPVVADMVRLHRKTGMRPTELCTIRPGNVDRSGDVWWYEPLKHKTQHLGRSRRIPIGPQGQAILAPYLDRDPSAYCFVPAESEAKRRAIVHGDRTTPLSCGNQPGTNRKRKPKRKAGLHYTEDSYRRAVAYGCEAAFGMPAELRKIPPKITDKKRAALLAKGRRVPDEISDEERQQRQKAATDWRAAHCWSPNQLRHLVATELRRKYKTEGASVVLGHAKLNTTEIYAEKDYDFAAEIARAEG